MMKDEFIEESKITSGSSNNKIGIQQKKINKNINFSFTPKTMTTSIDNSNWNEPNIISFDQVLKKNEDNGNEHSEMGNIIKIEKNSHHKRPSIPSEKKTEENFYLKFDEEYNDIVQSFKTFSKTKSQAIGKKKDKPQTDTKEEPEPQQQLVLVHPHNHHHSQHQQQQQPQPIDSSDDIKILNLTNIQEINDFYNYTEDCMKVIAKMKAPDISTLKERCITLPFESNIGFNKKRLAIFDLDETLIHCELNDIESAQTTIDIMLPIKKTKKVGLNVRPHWKEELLKISTRYYMIIYTASHHSYADSVLNHIDPNRELFPLRLYRSNCTMVECEGQNFYVKDLRIFKNISLSDMVIIDNSVLSFAFHLDNGIPILPYYRGDEDSEMEQLTKLLLQLADYPDMKETVKYIINLKTYKTKKKKKKTIRSSKGEIEVKLDDNNRDKDRDRDKDKDKDTSKLSTNINENHKK